jgi:hypothetical protein
VPEAVSYTIGAKVSFESLCSVDMAVLLTRRRKHELKHSLPWHCDVLGCSRNKGFTSKNDLDRHKRTVHSDRTVSGRAFVCNIGSCAKKTKIWPRADNFRSHLERMHHKTYSANDDLSEFIYRCVTRVCTPISCS